MSKQQGFESVTYVGPSRFQRYARTPHRSRRDTSPPLLPPNTRPIRRRRLLIGIAACGVAPTAIALPKFRIGILIVDKWDPADPVSVRPFLDELTRLGYQPGRDVEFIIRESGPDLGRLDDLARELVKLRVDVIIAGGRSATFAAKRATSSIPIVLTGANDPVADGLVASLAKPGGNVTGNADMGADLVVKQMELLAEMTGSRGPFGYVAAQVAVRYKSDDLIVAELRSFAESRGIRLVVSSVPIAVGSGESEFDRALAALKEVGVTGVLIDNNAAFDLKPKRVAQLLIDYQLPAIMDYRDYALAGVLMTYSEPNSDPAIRIAGFVDRILKGAKPEDLPVARPTRFDLVVNLTTAGKLKLRVPGTLLLMANEVVN